MTVAQLQPTLDFTLPTDLSATKPIEARGLARDAVRLMVSHYETDDVIHTRFTAIEDHLQAGDLLVVNTSGTLPAAVTGAYLGGPVHVHFSTQLTDTRFVIELRTVTDVGTQPYLTARANTEVMLDFGSQLRLLRPYQANNARLWLAELHSPFDFQTLLSKVGFPIRYDYVPDAYPLEYYQTVFATTLGSAEMPSAGRPFTSDVVTRLAMKGVRFAPVLLHTGVASLEDHEPPYAEYYEVSAATAELINFTKQQGGRVIGIGTTAVRAIESATAVDGTVSSNSGWTELVIGPERPLRIVDGILTGFHEPKASHLAMLAQVAGATHLEVAYAAALQERYLWHEFGDVHLLVA